jgi:hypothetical protein
MASFSLVPTPSVPLTSTGLACSRVGMRHKAGEPADVRARASGRMRSTSASPASMSTPASL